MVRVLYVDDDRINSLLFVETCRVAGGAEVETAATAGEALELVQTWAPDLLVIDLHLPDGAMNRIIERLTFAGWRYAARRADALVAYDKRKGVVGPLKPA